MIQRCDDVRGGLQGWGADPNLTKGLNWAKFQLVKEGVEKTANSDARQLHCKCVTDFLPVDFQHAAWLEMACDGAHLTFAAP